MRFESKRHFRSFAEVPFKKLSKKTSKQLIMGANANSHLHNNVLQEAALLKWGLFLPMCQKSFSFKGLSGK